MNTVNKIRTTVSVTNYRIDTKKCNKCKNILPIDRFYRNCEAKDGHYTVCKSCHNKYVEKYKQNKNKQNTNNALVINTSLQISYSDIELIHELGNRGYTGILKHEIVCTKIEEVCVNKNIK